MTVYTRPDRSPPNWRAIDKAILKACPHFAPKDVDTLTIAEIEFLLIDDDGGLDWDAIKERANARRTMTARQKLEQAIRG